MTDQLTADELDELPDWVESIHPNQVQAVWDILDAFDHVDHVFLDGPTGVGKTLIAELVRRELLLRTLYVCSGRDLQDQFVRDFPYAKVLKGRRNYPVQSGDPNHTADDCIAQRWEDPCWHCPDGKPGCPYEVAKREALEAQLAVTNTSYFLAEANYVGKFTDIELVIVDEGDTLESTLMGFVEYRVAQRYVDACKMEFPRKGVHKPTLIAWLDDYQQSLTPLAQAEQDARSKRAMQSSIRGAKRMMGEIQRDIDQRQSNDETTGMWLREYEKDRRGDVIPSLILKPVTVNKYGVLNLWKHGAKWLIMSATIISADEMADSLGLPFPYQTISMQSPFPVQNRPIIMAPIADLRYANMEEATKDLLYAIQHACYLHPDDRILIHSVSYSLAKKIYDGLRYGGYRCQKGRTVVSYTNSSDRAGALEKYIDTPGAILVSPSMERGIDLPDDLCRVQIIAKCPFPALKGVISARTHLPNGNLWYAVQTIRDIVQMAGRGVRHQQDWCVTYVFDIQFSKNLWSKWKAIFPKWFQAAVVTNHPIRDFVRPKGS